MQRFSDLKNWLLTKSIGSLINSLTLYSPNKAGEIAYKIFSNPRDGKLNDYTPFLNQAEKETILYKNHKIQTYHWNGEKETVLLIHGWESNSNRWQGMIQYLKKKKYNIICLDAPAQGMSTGKELNSVLYAEFINEACKKYQPKYLIGHSLGGMTMFYAASKYKFHHVEKMVGLGSPNSFNRITTNYKKMLSLNEKAYQAFLKVFITKFDIDTHFFNTENFIAALNQSILIIHDKNDSVVSYADSYNMKIKNPNIEYITTEDFGHSLAHHQVYKQSVSFLQNNLSAKK